MTTISRPLWSGMWPNVKQARDGYVPEQDMTRCSIRAARSKENGKSGRIAEAHMFGTQIAMLAARPVTAPAPSSAQEEIGEGSRAWRHQHCSRSRHAATGPFSRRSPDHP